MARIQDIGHQNYIHHNLEILSFISIYLLALVEMSRFTRKQVACLLACASFLAIPSRTLPNGAAEEKVGERAAEHGFSDSGWLEGPFAALYSSSADSRSSPRVLLHSPIS